MFCMQATAAVEAYCLKLSTRMHLKWHYTCFMGIPFVKQMASENNMETQQIINKLGLNLKAIYTLSYAPSNIPKAQVFSCQYCSHSDSWQWTKFLFESSFFAHSLKEVIMCNSNYSSTQCRSQKKASINYIKAFSYNFNFPCLDTRSCTNKIVGIASNFSLKSFCSSSVVPVKTAGHFTNKW